MTWKCLMFKNKARAKAIFTMWLHFHDRMHTSDRLDKWGIAVDTTCILCKLLLETRNHLFAECSFTKRVWDRLLLWMQRQSHKATTWDQHFRWTLHNAKGKSQEAAVFKMVYAEVVHEIWTERNLRIFEKKRRSVEAIARFITCTCHIRATTATGNVIQRLKF
ncbi:uncharacterized protein LOC132627381 [Lycium barbarum]|uniref:uncharacterized protein LOC132627381 n=1 Tax=Lycium barbarum TaxID=112863 RepID=UPI00293F0AE9|nr:uncharacterized protein LOC132627381 [Lycium barbarum]